MLYLLGLVASGGIPLRHCGEHARWVTCMETVRYILNGAARVVLLLSH